MSSIAQRETHGSPDLAHLAKHLQVQAQAERERRQREGRWEGTIVPHVEYQTRPIDWLVDKLGFRREDIVWSLRPEYAAHEWHGTKDPLAVALQALADNEWAAAESGSGTSKTYTLGAGATLWFLACWENARVFQLAPREDQLSLNMWKEVTKLWPRFQRLFPSAEMTSLTIRMRGGIDDSWAAHGMTARVGADEDIAGHARGFHEAHQLVIMEEGPGIHRALWESMQSTSGGGHNLILGLGNPDSVHDPLHIFCMKSRVVNVRISCFDYPNVVLDDPNVVPGATTRRWIEDRREEWGEGSNRYLRFVEGVAPEQPDDALIQLEWCQAAAKRWGDQSLRVGPRALGVDVADSPRGDESAISRWQGACCTEVVSFRAEDASEVGRVVYKEATDPDAWVDPKRIGIDSVGVGVSAINELKRLKLRVKHISGGTRAGPYVDVEALPEPPPETQERDDDERPRRLIVVEEGTFENLRSQVYWRLREDLRLQRIALPNDQELFRQLTAHTWRTLPTSKKTSIEDKDSVRAKLRRSPDKADAVAYGNFVRYRAFPGARGEQKPALEYAARERGVDKGLERLLEVRERYERVRKAERKRLMRRLRPR